MGGVALPLHAAIRLRIVPQQWLSGPNVQHGDIVAGRSAEPTGHQLQAHDRELPEP